MSSNISPDEIQNQANILKAKIYKQRIDDLVSVYGSVRAVGRALNIDHAYLHRLANGQKVKPSQVVLKKLGL